MMKFSLVEFSIRRPKLVLLLAGLLTLLFLTQFPKIRTDTNPKHMLPDTSDVRVWNDRVSSGSSRATTTYTFRCGTNFDSSGLCTGAWAW